MLNDDLFPRVGNEPITCRAYSRMFVPLRNDWLNISLHPQIFVLLIFFYQLHAVSRTLQGRQREPNVKTLRTPLSA